MNCRVPGRACMECRRNASPHFPLKCGAAAVIIAVLTGALLSSCSLFTPTDSDGRRGSSGYDYVIQVDSLRTTPTVQLGESVRVWLWGVVGTDGCHSFKCIEAWQESPWRVHLTAMGSQRVPVGVPCPPETVYMDWEEYSFVPTQEGFVEIVVENPDGSSLVDTVEVQPSHWKGEG